MVAAAGMSLALAACSSSHDGHVSLGHLEAVPRTPGAGQVFLAEEDVVGQTVTVSVRVRELAGIAAADLTLEYDPVRLVFVGWESGGLLEQGPTAVDYQVGEQIPGLLRVEASRASGTASAGQDDPVLAMLRFKVVAVGGTPALFGAGSAMLGPSAPLAGVTFFAGTFLGS
jgi:hypothetical protein